MMNLTLYKKEWKSNWLLLVIFLCILAMYGGMIVAMFDPKMADSLRLMVQSMPTIFAAFGMDQVGSTLLEFITGYLYGILLTAFPSVFFIILCNRLVAKYVDNGSMAYLLSAPEKRKKLICTQAAVLISMMLLMLAAVIVILLICSAVLFPGRLEIPGFLRVNVGMLGVWVMVGGVCFFASCFFNESRMCIGAGSAFLVYSLLLQMIAQMGKTFSFLKYGTPLTLFQANGLSANEPKAWIFCALMYLLGIAGLIGGIAVFQKKDLPI